MMESLRVWRKGFQSPTGPQTATPPTEERAFVGRGRPLLPLLLAQAAIVQLPLWDWLRHAGPPYDLSTGAHTHTHTHTPFETFLTCFPMVILPQNPQLVWEGAT